MQRKRCYIAIEKYFLRVYYKSGKAESCEKAQIWNKTTL